MQFEGKEVTLPNLRSAGGEHEGLLLPLSLALSC